MAGAAGVGAIAGFGIGEFLALPETGVSVIGHYPAYTEMAAELNANVFTVPMSEWSAMSPAEQWAANEAFLAQGVANGDTFALATPISEARAGSFFEQEINYLLQNGYSLNSEGTALVPDL